jgi:hypothetical protein
VAFFPPLWLFVLFLFAVMVCLFGLVRRCQIGTACMGILHVIPVCIFGVFFVGSFMAFFVGLWRAGWSWGGVELVDGVGLDWIGLDWIGLDWIGSRKGMGREGMLNSWLVSEIGTK